MHAKSLVLNGRPKKQLPEKLLRGRKKESHDWRKSGEKNGCHLSLEKCRLSSISLSRFHFGVNQLQIALLAVVISGNRWSTALQCLHTIPGPQMSFSSQGTKLEFYDCWFLHWGCLCWTVNTYITPLGEYTSMSHIGKYILKNQYMHMAYAKNCR